MNIRGTSFSVNETIIFTLPSQVTTMKQNIIDKFDIYNIFLKIILLKNYPLFLYTHTHTPTITPK